MGYDLTHQIKAIVTQSRQAITVIKLQCIVHSLFTLNEKVSYYAITIITALSFQVS
jgi:hypothetical protein